MNLSKATNNESQWAVRHKRFHPIFMPDCDTCQCLLLCRDLIAEVKRLQGFEQYKGLYEAEEIGQRGLREHLESARREKADLEQLREAMVKQNAQQEQEIEELEVKMCGIRKVLGETIERLETLIFRGDISPDDVITTREWQNRVKQARSSAPPACPHKEEAERLREEMVTGEAGGRLLQAVQEKTEAEVVALQATLDEERGKVMELKWRTLNHCITAERKGDGVTAYRTDFDPADPRHSWSRERWTEEQRKIRETK